MYGTYGALIPAILRFMRRISFMRGLVTYRRV